MKLRYSFFCDYVQGWPNGKLNAMGIFDMLNPDVIPSRMPPFFLLASFEAPLGTLPEGGMHVALKLFNPAGEMFWHDNQDMRPLAPPKFSDFPHGFSVAFPLVDIPILSEGTYTSAIELNDQTFTGPIWSIAKQPEVYLGDLRSTD